jgi:Trypsin-like peptidase domain/PDZ domain
LLSIDSDALPPLSWGDSSAVRAGQETWAIGNPLDIGISIARGTIAGLGGARIGLNQIESFLHSDAHITHGNSGGPLVDVYGHVLGVSDIGYSGAKGQGYSIPSLMAKYVNQRLRRDGRYERGYIGLHIRSIDTVAAGKFSLNRTDGSVVEWVVPGSPAAVAGLQPGDVVLGLEGHFALSTYLLQEAVSSVGPGARITLQIDRHGRTMELPVTTIPRPAAPRIDPIEDLEGYMRVRFEEDGKERKVYVRNRNRSRHAPGLYDGSWIKSVVPAQDWPEEAITLNYYKTRAEPIPIASLEELRAALRRAYVGGRVAVSFEIDYPRAPVLSVAFDELWPILL